MSLLKFYILISASFLASCGSNTTRKADTIERIIPDTLKSFYGRALQGDYRLSRNFEYAYHLPSLSNGTPGLELRFWFLSSSYDPQDLYILTKDSLNQWRWRVIRYEANKNNQVQTDTQKKIRTSFVDSLELEQFWTLPSIGDMEKGDTYGCVDGYTVLLEMSDKNKYKYAFYRCPDIHASKNNVFFLIDQLGDKLSNLE